MPHYGHMRSFAAISEAAGNTRAKMPTEATRMSVFPKGSPLPDDSARRGALLYTVVDDRATAGWVKTLDRSGAESLAGC